MSVLVRRAGTVNLEMLPPAAVLIRMKSPLIVLSSRKLPRSSGPMRPFVSSKVFGSAEIPAPELLVIRLKASVGRVLSKWIGANDCKRELSSTWPPPYWMSALEIEFRKACLEGTSES